MVACHITESHIITACLISNHLLFIFQQQTNDATSTWGAHLTHTPVTWHTHGMACMHVAPVLHVPGTRVEKAKCDHYLGGVFSCDMADALISTNPVCVAACRDEHSHKGVYMCGVVSDVRGMTKTTCFWYCHVDAAQLIVVIYRYCCRFFLLTHATTPVKPSPQQLYLGMPLIVNSVAAMH